MSPREKIAKALVRPNPRYQELYGRNGEEPHWDNEINPLNPVHPDNSSYDYGYDDTIENDAIKYGKDLKEYVHLRGQGDALHNWDVDGANSETATHQYYKPRSPWFLPDALSDPREIQYHDGSQTWNGPTYPDMPPMPKPRDTRTWSQRAMQGSMKR